MAQQVSTLTPERPVLDSPAPSSSRSARLDSAPVWPVLRIMLGLVFLWAFVDKLFALGFATGKNPRTGVIDRFGPAAWIHGGSPTKGFLSMGVHGPLAGTFKAMAGNSTVDWLSCSACWAWAWPWYSAWPCVRQRSPVWRSSS